MAIYNQPFAANGFLWRDAVETVGIGLGAPIAKNFKHGLWSRRRAASTRAFVAEPTFPSIVDSSSDWSFDRLPSRRKADSTDMHKAYQKYGREQSRNRTILDVSHMLTSF